MVAYPYGYLGPVVLLSGPVRLRIGLSFAIQFRSQPVSLAGYVNDLVGSGVVHVAVGYRDIDYSI